jgi:phage/plasmid-like protein (TIGR03299 family)
MAHQITETNGKFEFAFTGDRNKIWHGLGQQIEETATLEQWKQAAGMEWEAFRSVVEYQTASGKQLFNDRNVLFRSDTNEAMSVVSKDYKVVQPAEIMEFFRELIDLNGFKMSAAGTLFGGRRFWATADIGKSFSPINGDDIGGYLLVTTSIDGSLATSAKFTSTRTVCNNTLSIALSDKSRTVRQTHAKEWDAKRFKFDLGLVDESWDNFRNKITKLTQIEASDADALAFFKQKVFNKDVLESEQTRAAQKMVSNLMDKFRNGMGAEYHHGSAYGVLNAFTEVGTHGTGRRDPSWQFHNSYFGTGESLKTEIFNDLIALAA